MSAHTECHAVGKFDCAADSHVYDMTMLGDGGEGNVEAPSAWFDPIDLDPDTGDEPALIEHYGTRWIIARENSQGQFWVECYPTEHDRDERAEGLRAAYNEWDVAL